MDPFGGLNLDPAQYNTQQQPYDATSSSHLAAPPPAWLTHHDSSQQQHNGDAGHLETGLSTDDLAWLEQQLSLAAGQPQQPPPPALPPHLHPSGSSYSPNLNNFSQPDPNPAFPPVSNARFHPYSLPAERAQRTRAPPGGNLLSPHLQQLQQQYLLQQQQQQQQQAHLPPQRPPLGQSTSSTGSFDWPSFGTVASSFAPVPAPPPPQVPPHLSQAPSYPSSAPYAPTYPSPLSSAQLPVPPSLSAASRTPHQTVLYPPHDAPSPLLLPDEPSPVLPLAPHASPASAISSIATPRPISPSTGLPRVPRARQRRARSEPPPVKLPFPALGGSETTPAKKTARFAGLPSAVATKVHAERKKQQLDSLFGWLDAQRWSFSTLFTALSDVDPGSSAAERAEAAEHKRRLDEFLQLDGDGGGLDEGAKAVREARRRLAFRRGEGEGEKGPDEVVRMWEDMGGLGRSREGHMANAVRELHSNVHDGAVAGVSIRRIINRYGEAYNESASDIKRLDAALALPPSPHLTSVPREAAVWTGVLVIPPTQAELVQGWLAAPGRPNIGDERGKIEPEHMRIYSSLSPLDLHARGAELCRVILLRDVDAMRQHGHNFDRLHLFTRGPTLAPLDTCGFAQYDGYSLFHHAVMVYLQLCVRYPGFREGKEATIHILPDLPPPVHPTPLETLLIDRALHSHWDNLRLFLLDSHGGLLRSAVRAFAGVKLSKVDLLSVCDDTWAVIEALKKNKKNSNDRILKYDPAISQVRNVWRQRAFYDETAELVAWSAATTHFLELSALFPEFGLGVRDLPGLESLLGQASSSSTSTGTPGATSSTTPGSVQNGGPSPMSH
ncbi:hypothetical protein JCM6882_004726 [Rhodosporidiobolus microsporus]